MGSRMRRWFSIIAALTLAASLALPVAAAGSGQGGSGGGGEETVSNSLSVPAIFVPSASTFGFTCDGTTINAPTGDPQTGFEVPGYYYVQGVNSWQAQCNVAAADTVTATADWGDNLTGTALHAGAPIRVEVGLIDDSGVQMQGYQVIKLEPSLLDRESAYGTLATPSGDTYAATQTTYPYTGTTVNPETGQPETTTTGIRVWDSQATFSIHNDSNNTWVVPEGTAISAEINATGTVVYGFNWGTSSSVGLPTAGTYTLKFTAPQVTLSNSNVTDDPHSVTLTFVINATGGGGKGGRSGGGSGGGETVTHDAQVVSVTAPTTVYRGTSPTISAVVRNNGTQSETISVALAETPDGFAQSQSVTVAAVTSTTVNFSWPTSETTTLGTHTFTVTATVASDSNAANNTGTATTEVLESAPETTVMAVSGISLSWKPGPLSYQATLIGVVTIKAGTSPVQGATVNAKIVYGKGLVATVSGTTDAAGQATLSKVFSKPTGSYTLTVTGVTKAGMTYDSTLNTVTSQTIAAP